MDGSYAAPSTPPRPRLTTDAVERVSMRDSHTAAKHLGLDRHGMRALTPAERVRMVHAAIGGHAADGEAAGGAGGAESEAPRVSIEHTRDSMRTLSSVDRVAAVMQHLDEGVSHEELLRIHGPRSVQGLSQSSHALVHGTTSAAAAAPPPPSPAPGGGSESADALAARVTSVHARSALQSHDSKMEAMKHLLLSVKMLREKPLLTNKLQEIARVLAAKMNENPATAAVLEGHGIEDRLRDSFSGMLDTDHDGQLAFAEFRAGLTAVHIDLGSDIRGLFEAIDTDNSGTVDLPEFIAAISAAKSIRATDAMSGRGPPGFGREPEMEPAAGAPAQGPHRSEFEKHDLDRDQKLNQSELTAFLQGHGFDFDAQHEREAYVAELLSRYGGLDGSGVAFEQFSHMWQHLFETGEGGERTVNLPVDAAGFGFELVAGPEGSGAVVVGTVQPGSGAALAGIAAGDVAVTVGSESLQGVSPEAANAAVQREVQLAVDVARAREQAGGRFKCVKEAPLRTQPSFGNGIAVSTVKAGVQLNSRGSEVDESGVRWVHAELGWAPTRSAAGDQLIVSLDGRGADGPAVVPWQFGPPLAAALAAQEPSVEDLKEAVVDCRRILEQGDIPDRADVLAQMKELQAQLATLGHPQDPADESRDLFLEYDRDGDRFLNAQELNDLLLGMNFSQDEVTSDYIYECLVRYGANQMLDCSQFEQLYAALLKPGEQEEGAAPEDAAIPPVAEPEAPAQPAQLSDAEIAAKFDLYDTDGDGFLRPEDLVKMLVAEFGFEDSAETDGVAAEALEWFGQYDTNDDGNIDSGEFPALWQHFAGGEQAEDVLPDLSPAELQEKFDFYDKNGNGLLGIDEIKEMVVAECGYQDDADTARFCAEVLEDFGQYDANDDNNIDPDEFGDLWRYLMKCVNEHAGEDGAWGGGGGGQGEAEVFVPRDPGSLGFEVREGEGEAEVLRVDDALAAEETGLKEGDIILAVDDVRVANGDEALQQLSEAQAAGTRDPIKVTVLDLAAAPAATSGSDSRWAESAQGDGAEGRRKPKGAGLFSCITQRRRK